MDDKLKGLVEAYMKRETHESISDLESMIKTIGWRIVENTYISPSSTFSTEYLLQVALYLYLQNGDAQVEEVELEERREEEVVAQVEGTGTSKEVELEERREEEVVAQVKGTGTSKEVELEERREEEVVAQVEGTGTSKEVELEEKRKVEVLKTTKKKDGNAGVKNEHRYTSPVPYNKTYCSLLKVCDFLTEPGVGSSTKRSKKYRQKEDGGTAAAKQGTTAAAEQGTAAEEQGTTSAVKIIWYKQDQR